MLPANSPQLPASAEVLAEKAASTKVRAHWRPMWWPRFPLRHWSLVFSVILDHFCWPFLRTNLAFVHFFYCFLFHGRGKERRVTANTSSVAVTTSSTCSESEKEPSSDLSPEIKFPAGQTPKLHSKVKGHNTGRKAKYRKGLHSSHPKSGCKSLKKTDKFIH